jgi:hypothetical protein
MAEIFVSTDVETDGPIPGPNSMLSFGSAAYLPDRTLVSTFTANLEALPGASPHSDTMKWWYTQPKAWEVCRRNPQPPEKVMKRYGKWLKRLPGDLVFVGYPASFDFCFINWYLIKFTGENPFLYFALDVKTYAVAMLRKEFRTLTKSTMPQHWFEKREPTHIALDDAIQQGILFCNMRVENLQQK